MTTSGHFLDDTYVFVQMQHGCLINRNSALYPGGSVVKRL